MEIDWKNHAKNLKEIGNRMADELSVMAHTKGITVRANAALKDWDPAVVSFYQDMHKNGDKLI